MASGGLCVGYVLVHVPESRAWGIGVQKCQGREGKRLILEHLVEENTIKVRESQPLRPNLAISYPRKG